VLYFLVRYMREHDLLLLSMAGLMMVWAYFMRPVMVVIAVFVVLFVLGYIIKARRPLFRSLLAFLLPIIVVQAAWTIRNRVEHGRFLLLTTSTYYPSYTSTEIATWRFVGTFDQAPAMYFFEDRMWPDRQVPLCNLQGMTFPAWIFNDAFNLDSLQDIRKGCARLMASNITTEEKEQLDLALTERLDRYTASIHRTDRFHADVITPLILLRHHVFGSSGAYNLFLAPFAALSVPAKAIKLCCIAVYLIALYGALFFIPWALWNWREGRWVLVIPLVFALTCHPFLFRMGDVRYLYTFYPLFCVCASVLYVSLLQRYRAGRLKEVPTAG
jgi:hypothetical protein